jgi:hypothetical protein
MGPLGAGRVRILLSLLPFALAIGCGTSEASDDEATEDELRSDPNALVWTHDPGVHLLAPYNAFLDRTPTTECVTGATGAIGANVGDLRGEFYLRHINTREELAKELEVDVGASAKLPRGSIDASVKVVTTFKSSATTATFIVRAVRSYAVTPRGTVKLTPEAEAMLVQNDADRFLATCGGSFARSVRYEAQVLGLLQFEAKTEEAARKIQTSFGGSLNAIAPIASANAELKTRAEETARKNDATLTVTVAATGFVARDGTTVATVADPARAFEQIDALRGDMNASFDGDLSRDRQDYFANNQRNARPSQVVQAPYRQLPNAPQAFDYTRLTTRLQRAEEFFDRVASVQVRMETIYGDEIDRFLSDTHRWGGNQFRYNVLPSPQLSTNAVVPFAQKYAAMFKPHDGTLVQPLRMVIERCLSGAGSGDYHACETDPVIDGDMQKAETAIDKYADEGRIVPIVAWMPTLGATMSHRNAGDACRTAGMRLPKRDEMKLIAPAVTALANPTGEVWFAADAQCQKPFFANGSGQGEFKCGETATEGLPYVSDRPVVCVGLNGPVPAMPRP